MKRILLVACAAWLSGTANAFAVPVYAAWVASFGNDTNDCTRTAPCASFTAAFAQVRPSGVIHVVDTGAFGPLTITHSVTIDGGGLGNTFGAQGLGIAPVQFTVNAGTSDVVTIQNLTLSGAFDPIVLSGAPTGIRVNSVGSLHVQHCVFDAFIDRAIDFRATGAELQMKEVTINDMATGTGVYVANARASLEHVSINKTQTAVIAAGSSTVSVTHSTFNGNGTALAAAYGPTAQLNADDCVLTNNQWGIVAAQGAKAYVSRSALFNNFIVALFNDGMSSVISYGDNRFAGNASDGTFTSMAAPK